LILKVSNISSDNPTHRTKMSTSQNPPLSVNITTTHAQTPLPNTTNITHPLPLPLPLPRIHQTPRHHPPNNLPLFHACLFTLFLLLFVIVYLRHRRIEASSRRAHLDPDFTRKIDKVARSV
jgi:hypothetical protein